MLEQMRNQSGSFVIWVLFAVIIAAFVLFFGSPSDSLGCGSTNDYAIKVDNKEVTVQSWRFEYNLLQKSPVRRAVALDLLLRRELLAQAAVELDFQISEEVMTEAIMNGELYGLAGQKMNGKGAYFPRDNDEDEEGYFSYDALEQFAKGRLALPSVAAYREELTREMLAYLMSQEILTSANVSKEEVRDQFVAGNTKVSAEYVKFPSSAFISEVKLSEADIKAYSEAHAEELQAKWEDVKSRWEDDKPRVKIRIIRITKATATKAEGESDTPAEAAPEVAELNAIRERILGGEDFATVAAEVSKDRTAAVGGWVGWRSADSMGYGQPVIDGTVDLKVGDVSEVITVGRNLFLVKIEERSDKGLTFAQKRFDLAVREAPTAAAQDAAKLAAEQALTQAATTPLATLFPKPSASTPGVPNLNAEDLKKLAKEDIQIPGLTGNNKPSVKTIQDVTRNGDSVAGLRSKELVDALFGELASDTLASKVYQVENYAGDFDGYVVVKLTDRTEADMEQFEADAADMQARFAEGKGAQLLGAYLQEKCRRLKDSDAITFNSSLLVSGDSRVPYVPCETSVFTR